MSLLSNAGIRAGASSGGTTTTINENWGTDDPGRSVRFASNDSAYFSKTFSAGNQQKWTFSCWVKRSGLGSGNYTLFSADESNTDFVTIRYEGDQLRVDAQGDGQSRVQVTTSPYYRDPAAWYHVVVALDTTQGTAANRCKIYVNGVQQTTTNTFTQNKNFAVNAAVSHEIGRRSDGNDNYFEGNLADIHFFDGQQYAASDIGETDANGVWQPQSTLETLVYGNRGFFLKFDNASELGHDRCGNNNDWTANNIMHAAGAGKVWSDDITESGNWSSNHGSELMLDGDLSTNPYCGAGNVTATATFDPIISYSSSIKVYGYDHNNPANQYKLHINGTQINQGGSLTTTDVTSAVSSAGGLQTVQIGDGNGTWSVIRAIYVDGVLLKDGGHDYGIDYSFDHPVSGGTDTGEGGEVTGNCCTMNPLDKHSNVDLEQGNLYVKREGAWKHARGTWGLAAGTGKYYFEAESIDPSGTPHGVLGIATKDASFTESYGGAVPQIHAAYVNATSTGGMNIDGSWTGNVNFTAGNYIGVAVDTDNKTVRFYRNGTIDSAATSWDQDGPYFPWVGSHSTGWILNFGQRAFKYDAPNGYKALCTHNLPTPDIVKPHEHFDIAQYTGTGSALTVSSLNFQPDFTWIKSRSSGDHNHLVYDDLRGATKYLSTNGTGHGDTAALSWTPTSTGYTISTNSNYNTSGDTYVSWNWKAATVNSSANTNGENIDVAVGKQQVNTTAGFSITQYEGDGSGTADSDSGDSVGHGLSKTPEFLMLKRFDLAVNNWICWYTEFGDAKMFHINTNGAKSGTNYCIPTAPTSTKVDLGNNPEANKTGDDYMLYCWHSVDGYSKIGNYEGNGDSNGPFVFCGFRPAMILVKKYSAAEGWNIMDTDRSTYNPVGVRLVPNTSGAEDSNASHDFDFLSNGFKLRNSDGWTNGSGADYFFMAFAENPFKYSRAR